MARKRQHEELKGLFYDDLEFLIKQLTVGALAYRNRDILRDTVIEGYSYDDVGKKYGLCKTRVKTITRKFCENVKVYRTKHPDL